MAAEGVLSVENGQGFGVDLPADGENRGVEGACVGGRGEEVGAVGIGGWVVEEEVVDLLADLEGKIEEIGHSDE